MSVPANGDQRHVGCFHHTLHSLLAQSNYNEPQSPAEPLRSSHALTNHGSVRGRAQGRKSVDRSAMRKRGTITAKRVQETCARGVQGLPSLATKDKHTRGCGDVETLLASVRRAAGRRCLRHSHLTSRCVRGRQIYSHLLIYFTQHATYLILNTYACDQTLCCSI